MYCMNCGKPTDNPGGICDDCERDKANKDADFYFGNGEATSQQAQTFRAAEKPKEQEESGSRMTGFGPALAAAIVGLVGFVLVYISMSFAVARAGLVATGHGSGAAAVGITTTCVVLLILSLVSGVVGIVFGARSIKCFKAEKEAGRKKPIPTLVLGIVGLVLGIIVLVSAFITFIILMVSVGAQGAINAPEYF